MRRGFRPRFILLLALPALSLAAPSALRAAWTPYADAEPVLRQMREGLPAPLAGKSPAQLRQAWPVWVRHNDADIRARLRRGEADTLVNLLNFGISFTRQPRITLAQLQRVHLGAHEESVDRRIDDLARAIARPGSNERLQFAHDLLAREGFKFSTPADVQRIREYLKSNLRRVLREQETYASTLAAARHLSPTDQFAERSTVFSDRGLSFDTSLMPNLGIERALADLKLRGLLKPGTVKRVAVIGPGLDFTDKASGYDFYPEQTVQPFAVMDSLLRLGLGDAKELQLVTLDISPSVNQHIRRMRAAADAGKPYTIQLPLDESIHWKPESVAYWERFGAEMGKPVPPIPLPPEAKTVKVRAVQFPADSVQRITPVDLNIVVQQLQLPPQERFDVIVATNILVYYDVFQQCLAMRNIATMLRPGGFLLSNDALLELPESPLHGVDYTVAEYSDRRDDGDHVVWYQK